MRMGVPTADRRPYSLLNRTGLFKNAAAALCPISAASNVRPKNAQNEKRRPLLQMKETGAAVRFAVERLFELSVASVREAYRKPGSVLLCGADGNYPPAMSDNHLSRPSIAERLERPT